MIRKVYGDLIIKKLRSGEAAWLARRVAQYVLIHASFFSRRPLCGPALGTLITNYRCNYHCQMCDLPLRDEELRAKGLRELVTDELKQLIRAFADLGTPGIGFTGGEPLLRKDIFELLAYTKSSGMITHLNTNGFFVDEVVSRKILDAKVDSINISLDGATAGTHDRIRGVTGAFDRVVRAFGILLDRRKKQGATLRIKAVGVLDETNIDEVPAMVGLGSSLGLDCIEFIPRQRFRSVSMDDAGTPDRTFLDKVDALQKYLLAVHSPAIRIENSPAHIRLFRHSFQGSDSPIACYAGYNSFAVDCYGELYPCVPWVNWRRSVGNIKESGLKEFWYSREYDQVRRGIRSCRKCYLNCQSELNILFNRGGSYGRTP